MNASITARVKQVLREAATDSRFSNLPDGDLLIWMIGRGYELGLKRRIAVHCRTRPADGKVKFYCKKT
jgi:hypothetical protein